MTSINRKARKTYFNTKLKENRARPKASWNTLRKVLPGKHNISEIKKLVVNGKELNDRQDVANSLNEYFIFIQTYPNSNFHLLNNAFFLTSSGNAKNLHQWLLE